MFSYRTILLVDDNDTTNFLHRRLLKRMAAAHTIAEAGNGEEALFYLRTHATNPENTPLLILLDINMPVMDGFEFMQEYEKSAGTGDPDIQVVMLSSSVSSVDLARIKEFPRIAAYYNKPLSEGIVQKILAEKQP
ncbi:MAG: response regulator receiver protein [Adhaeribacter sp.]|jgi:CheY-like chemotaxis protein|nr:response regulator receiver protein [Adhaeribacter sp.]